MEDAFGVVLVVVVVVAAIVAIILAVGAGKAYDQIGRGGLSLSDGTDRPEHEPASTGAAALADRDDEIRQMLEARNERRLRQGREPLDVEEELRRLTALVVDAALVLEIRQLVEARNARRIRQGKEPLDVEAEVARQVRELGGG